MARGILEVGAINFGAGDGALVFSHTATGLAFAPALTNAAFDTHADEVLAGVTRLTADSSGFDGITSLRDGRLDVAGDFGERVDVLGSTLDGCGTVRALAAGSSGIVAPGNSIGTLHVARVLHFAAGSLLRTEIAGKGSSDLVSATGTAANDGATVQVVALDPQPCYRDGTICRILDAARGVSGRSRGATTASAFIPRRFPMGRMRCCWPSRLTAIPVRGRIGNPSQSRAVPAGRRDIQPASGGDRDRGGLLRRARCQ